jgi:addiction module HigA family antidote
MTNPGQKHAPAHPGQILRGELAGLGMSQLELAAAMGRPPQVVSEIVTGKKSITPDTAIDLEEALGIDAGFWLRAQAVHELAQARLRRSTRA